MSLPKLALDRRKLVCLKHKKLLDVHVIITARPSLDVPCLESQDPGFRYIFQICHIGLARRLDRERPSVLHLILQGWLSI